MTIDLEDLNAREGWLLESRIDPEGDAEVTPLLVVLLLASIFCIYRSHGFLRSMEIMQKSISGGGKEIFQELCG